MAKRDETITIENAQVLGGNFRNFAGEKRMFNETGKRQFSILLPEDLADQMRNDGWNVKRLKEREVDDETIGGESYITVEVGFGKGKPPLIILISGKNRTVLDADTVGILDYSDIENWDLILNPYHWEVNDKSGIKAYVKSMYVTLEMDELAMKYADLEG